MTKRSIHLIVFLFPGLIVAAGCNNPSPENGSDLRLEATGDPGVEAHLVVKRDGNLICTTNLLTPGLASWSGDDFEITCTPAGKPGHLRIRTHIRDSETSLDANEPGTVLKITLHHNVIESTTTDSSGTAVSQSRF